jgi:hypothetical protein
VRTCAKRVVGSRVPDARHAPTAARAVQWQITLPIPTTIQGNQDNTIVADNNFTLSVPTWLFSVPYTGQEPNYTIKRVLAGASSLPPWAFVQRRVTCTQYGTTSYCNTQFVMAGRAPSTVGVFVLELSVYNQAGAASCALSLSHRATVGWRYGAVCAQYGYSARSNWTITIQPERLPDATSTVSCETLTITSQFYTQYSTLSCYPPQCLVRTQAGGRASGRAVTDWPHPLPCSRAVACHLFHLCEQQWCFNANLRVALQRAAERPRRRQVCVCVRASARLALIEGTSAPPYSPVSVYPPSSFEPASTFAFTFTPLSTGCVSNITVRPLGITLIIAAVVDPDSTSQLACDSVYADVNTVSTRRLDDGLLTRCARSR